MILSTIKMYGMKYLEAFWYYKKYMLQKVLQKCICK